jgi:hypothetical protein
VELSDELLKELNEREARYGVKLRTVRDRLEERFTRPLEIDRAAAQVPAAAEAARSGAGENGPAFVRLRTAVEPLEAIVSGVGLDVPAWVRRLEDALRHARDKTAEPPPGPPPGLTFDDLEKADGGVGQGLGGVTRPPGAFDGHARAVGAAGGVPGGRRGAVG